MAEEKGKLLKQQSQEATDLALHGKWAEAAALNRRILEAYPTDVDTLNRLGRALVETGELSAASEAYSRALELDQYNTIARKNLARLSTLSRSEGKPRSAPAVTQITPDLFLTEMGKSGVVHLELQGDKGVLARLSVGEPVNLVARGGNLIVENSRQEYLGEVEPRYGLRLAKLVEGGNRYTAAIASLDSAKLKVVIREVFQHPSQRGRPSFPVKIPTWGQQYPYTKDRLIRQDYEREGGLVPEEEEETIPDGFSIVEEAEAEAEAEEEEFKAEDE